MIKFRRKNGSYIVAVLAVMVLNFGLGLYLLNSAFAQTSDFPEQKPLNVHLEIQPNVPIHINIGSIDNSGKDLQTIHYIVANTSSKPVYAYVMLQKDSVGVGKIVTSYLSSKFFPGKTIANSLSIERPNVKPDGNISLFVDYVEFVDGSSWGMDTQRHSERIQGFRIGKAEAVSHIGDLLAENKLGEVLQLLEIEISALFPSSIDKEKSDLWQRGVREGYRSVVSSLRTTFTQKGSQAIFEKFEEIAMETRK